MEIFIAGTDTGAGKTFVTAALAAALASGGRHIGVQKWITTGGREKSIDIEFVQKGLSSAYVDGSVEFSSPCCLSFPASPHLAAEIDGVSIDMDEILASYRELASRTDILLVEGTGGIMVPITRNLLYADVLERIRPMVILVARSGLGTINHTLLTIDALRQRGVHLLCVVMNSISCTGTKDDSDSAIVNDNVKIISTLGKVKVFGPWPYEPDPVGETISKHAAPVAELIVEQAGAGRVEC